MADQQTPSLLDAACTYREAGLCVLPAHTEHKRPALSHWKPYQKRLPTIDELKGWFRDASGLCLITGAVSGNLEMIDFDVGGELFDRWARLVRAEAPGLLERLVIEQSQSGGKHAIYRCRAPVCGNMRLARRRIITPDEKPITLAGKQYTPRKAGDCFEIIVTLIETRGEGGLFLCHPSPGYELIQGTLEATPVLTDQERDILLEAARSLNELLPEPVAATPAGHDALAVDRPGDAFNRQGDVREVLKRHGWTPVRGGENEYWRRPGKTAGWSATLKDNILYVFSTNAAPFEPEKSYSPFAVYALLEHGGDFARAASALAANGFGQTTPATDVDLSHFGQGAPIVEPKPIRDLLRQHPLLRPPVIMGLLRQGETMNVIAPSKTGKSWLVLSLAMSVATGRPWLGSFGTVAGDVLILDNELHAETLAHRIPQVAESLGIGMDEIAETICVQSLRGQLRDLFSLQAYFGALERGRFSLVVLDAFYRFMPRDMDENDNGTMASLYNHIDLYADRLGCSFVLIHHTTKGNQSAKSVTDVGAGAGSQSRAADTHLVMRPHEEPGAVVLDAAVRSWAPVEPSVLRWTFPVWTPASELDPTALRNEKRKTKEKPRSEWTADTFVGAFLAEEIRPREAILSTARKAGLSTWRATCLLREAEAQGLVHRHGKSRNRPSGYSTQPPAEEGGEA